jgi:hypothetical protein
MKLLSVKKSTAKNKKWTATFEDGEKTKKVHFGHSDYQDFTMHKDETRRKSYRARHASGRTAKPDTPNALSYWLLWGNSTSLASNIKSFKNKYNL